MFEMIYDYCLSINEIHFFNLMKISMCPLFLQSSLNAFTAKRNKNTDIYNSGECLLSHLKEISACPLIDKWKDGDIIQSVQPKYNIMSQVIFSIVLRTITTKMSDKRLSECVKEFVLFLILCVYNQLLEHWTYQVIKTLKCCLFFSLTIYIFQLK